MLRDIEAPSDLASIDRASWLSAHEKLARIENESFEVLRGQSGVYYIRHPLLGGACFGLLAMEGEDRDTIHIESIHVGDKDLYKQGIGTRLVKTAIAYALEHEPTVRTLSTTHARLGLVNTVVKTLGKKNVRINKLGMSYGNGTDRLLDEIFDDFPAQTGQRYLVNSIKAHIDHETVAGWNN